jgi:MFS family permease
MGGYNMDPYHETYQGAPEPQPETNEIPLAKLMQWEKQFRDGANWFYWIAGLSALSSILLLIGSNFISAITLGSTQFLVAIGQLIPEMAIAAVIASVLILGVFVLLGYLSNKGHRWAYIIGIILFALDTLLQLWVQDFFGMAFHALALYFLIVGVIALYKLKKLLPQN